MRNAKHKPIVFLFSGQGAHYYQMGRELFNNNACFKKWMCIADDLIKSKIGSSVLDILYSDQVDKKLVFNQTLLTHPAIFMLQYALAQSLIAEEIIPTHTLGTSLGEFVAATISNIIDFETALNAVILQAQLIEQYCQPASMIAVLHDIQLYHESEFLFETCELASINFDKHFVITCENDYLQTLVTFLKKEQITHQVLPINHGFHSKYIDDAASDYIDAIKNITLRPAAIPFVSSMLATTADNIEQQHLWDAVRKPILFQKTINFLEEMDCYNYVDVGPSGTLATFIKYNLSSSSESKLLPILTPYGNDINSLCHIKTAIYI